MTLKILMIHFVNRLVFEDGAATLTEYTAQIILQELLKCLFNVQNIKYTSAGGGRKNKFLIKSIKEENLYF